MLTNKEKLAKFMGFLGYVTGAIYIGLGIILFIPGNYPYIPAVLKYSFALFFIAYGIFRLVKLITRKSELND